MTPNCFRHASEMAEDECKECQLGYCAECLVYVNGPRARPMCMRCAMARAGIRKADAPKLSRRQRRALRHRPAHAEGVAAVDVDAADDEIGSWASLDTAQWDVGTA